VLTVSCCGLDVRTAHRSFGYFRVKSPCNFSISLAGGTRLPFFVFPFFPFFPVFRSVYYPPVNILGNKNDSKIFFVFLTELRFYNSTG
jgi:hypothetical protein